MHLSRNILTGIQSPDTILPPDSVFSLPEKVLQFGTGVLLRALPDYFIDKANRQGIFNGRVVIVKSTSQGDVGGFARQDGLYTVCVRGIQEDKLVKENIVNASVSRVLNANEDWAAILLCARNPEMKIIISNTTEVGIQLLNEDVSADPPFSFPGKLLAFLRERYIGFAGSAESGMVIIPTELIPDNGIKLKDIVTELARLNHFDEAFLEWLENSNHFCNSLVDRIVPGKPDKMRSSEIEAELGYQDELLIISEVYRLWAIEGNEEIRSVLSFAEADAGVVIAEDIRQFRELKLRLLNGTHTLSCAVAFLSGIKTVREAMEDKVMSSYVQYLMMNEIAAAIPLQIDDAVSADFGNKVLDRFRNPEIEHRWINISVQYSSKIRMRTLPVLQKYVDERKEAPIYVAFGFAAYILFMKVEKNIDNQFWGSFQGVDYPINDDKANIFMQIWKNSDPADVVNAVLADVSLWGTDLTTIPSFVEKVQDYLQIFLQSGVRKGLNELVSLKTVA